MINHYFPAGTSYHLKKMDGLVVKEYENTLKYALAHFQTKNLPAVMSCVKKKKKKKSFIVTKFDVYDVVLVLFFQQAVVTISCFCT